MLLEEEEGHFLVGLASNLVVSEGHMDSFSTNLKCYLLVAYSLFLKSLLRRLGIWKERNIFSFLGQFLQLV